MKLLSSLIFISLIFSASCAAGKRSIQHVIVGGEVVQQRSYPWMAALIENSGFPFVPPSFFCGGSLISQRYVLTAAHCLASKKENVSRLRVILGDNNRWSIKSQQFSVERIAIHPEYNSSKFDYDIAVMKLTEDVSLTEDIFPASLDYSGIDLKDKKVTAIGWGRTELFPYAVIKLREVEISVVSQEQCNASYSSLTPSQLANGITDKFVCAGEEEGGKDACQGDSGGPLLFKLPGGNWTQVGITSFGAGCGRPGYPGVYTRVFSHLPFIYDNTDVVKADI